MREHYERDFKVLKMMKYKNIKYIKYKTFKAWVSKGVWHCKTFNTLKKYQIL